MPLEINTLLHGRYQVLAKLGRGGMSQVYRGYDESLGVEVAIKENLAATPEGERQFQRGAGLLASLRHPNLPRLTDHFVIPGEGQYLVMDFIPGEDARSLLERKAGPIAQGEVLSWAREILEALIYLHSRPQPVIHRDVKPGNIKITPDGRAILVDFGLAKFHDPTTHTTVGAKALTPGFAPPEQYGQGRTDARSDIYSLAATLYYLLTAQMPADGLERAMGQKRLAPLLELNPTVSPHVAAAIERALALEPQGRFASAQELAEALFPLAQPESSPATLIPAQAGVSVAPPEAKPARRRPSPGRDRLLIPVLIVVFLLGAGSMGAVLLGGLLRETSPTPTQSFSPGTTLPVVALGEDLTPTPTASQRPTPTQAATETPAPSATPTPTGTPLGGGSGEIAFVSDRLGAPQIFLMNADGTQLTQLTTIPDGACQPAWSPDGLSLLVVSPCRGKGDDYPRAGIFQLQLEDGSVRPMIALVGSAFDPEWSESGIAFTYALNGRPRIWVAAQDGSDEHAISQTNSADRQPSWAPDGERLVFMNTSRAGRATIYWMFKDGNFDGPAPDPVTRDRPASSPDWSPLGDRVAYVANGQIWVAPWEAKGFDAVGLTTRGPNADPDWSPDGQWIVFESWRDAADHELYLMAADGSSQTRITDHPAQDYQPAWRPGGGDR
ncbi:MAG TPA: protein kinase [Anaerolineales bacterium]|nr:protein kinase [Anaerolineales bacterium]